MIDFIDMEERRNNRAVEKKLKDCFEKRPRQDSGRSNIAFRLAGNVKTTHACERFLKAQWTPVPCAMVPVTSALIPQSHYMFSGR